jgi:hypothetical protein
VIVFGAWAAQGVTGEGALADQITLFDSVGLGASESRSILTSPIGCS